MEPEPHRPRARERRPEEIAALAAQLAVSPLMDPRAARALRLRAGLSLREMAALVGDGVRFSTVQRWEAGHHRPRGSHRVAYVRTLKMLAELGPPS